MRRAALVVGACVVVIAIVVVVAVGNRSTPSSRLARHLLPGSAMPAGWLPKSFADSVKGTGCLASVLTPKGVTPTAEAQALYVNDGSVPPEIGEVLASYRDPGAAYSRIVAAMDRCKYINAGGTNGSGISGTVARMSIPEFGVPATGFAAQVSDTAVPVTLNVTLIVARKGRDLVEVDEVNLGRVNASQFNRYVHRALARL